MQVYFRMLAGKLADMSIPYSATYRTIVQAFGNTMDVICMPFRLGERQACFFFLDGFIDKLLFEENIMQPLKDLPPDTAYTLDTIQAATIVTTPVKALDNTDDAIRSIAGGDIVLLIDEADELYLFSEKKYSVRGIQEPPVSTVLRGPREGFVEDFKTNMTMLRRRLATEKLRFDLLSIGKYTATRVVIAWLDGVADPAILKQVKERLQAIDRDGIVESSYLARYLEAHKLSIFSQVGATEKPDIATAKMLEGRIAILVDGSPMVLTLPFVLYESFQASEDYYIKSYRASLIRAVRLMAVMIAILLPAVYVALQQFQYQMFPLKFLITIMNSIYGIPLTPTLEMLLVLVIFEILNEASVRMPRYVGMALSIVGAIVLGETAVNAGLLSTPAILVIALSTIGLYCVPDESNTSSVLRFLFVTVAGVLGILGVLLSAIMLIAYLCSLESFGTSFMAPFSPSLIHDWQDGILKSNVTDMPERPYTIPTPNRTRIKK